MMKNILPGTLVLLFLTGICLPSLFAQVRPQLEERLQAQKTAFFTERMQLTVKEAEKFWPVYNDYSSRKEKISMESSTTLRYFLRNAENLSEQETQELLTRYTAFQQQDHELFMEYDKKFREILPPSKILKLYSSELQFRQHLLEQLRDQRQERGGARFQ
jgi:hypothetical protein